MRHKAITLFAASFLLLSGLTLTGCAHRHHAAAPYYEISPGVRLPQNDSGESQHSHLTVSVDNTHFKLDGKTVSLPVLRTELRRQVALHSNLEVIISASKKTGIVRIQQAFNAAEATNPRKLLITATPTPVSGKATKIKSAEVRP